MFFSTKICDPARPTDFYISPLIRLLFETSMRGNALARVYLHLTGFSVMIHTLHMQHSNTSTLRTSRKCNKWLSSRLQRLATLLICICTYIVIITGQCHKIQIQNCACTETTLQPLTFLWRSKIKYACARALLCMPVYRMRHISRGIQNP